MNVLDEILSELKAIRSSLVPTEEISFPPFNLNTHDKEQSPPEAYTFPPATFDDLRKIFRHASQLGHKERLRAILDGEGVERLNQLPPDKYDEIYERVNGFCDE